MTAFAAWSELLGVRSDLNALSETSSASAITAVNTRITTLQGDPIEREGTDWAGWLWLGAAGYVGYLVGGKVKGRRASKSSGSPKIAYDTSAPIRLQFV